MNMNTRNMNTKYEYKGLQQKRKHKNPQEGIRKH